MGKKLISIVIPTFNEELNTSWLYEKLRKELFVDSAYKFETVYVDDGSTDKSLEVIKSLHAKYPSDVRYVSFSRNFGKETAVSAGIHAAKGDAVVVIDADGQHPIKLVHAFIEKWNEGSEVIIGQRQSNKKEGLISKLGSKFFYALLRMINGKQSVLPGSTDFRLLDRKVVNEYNKLTERNRVSRNLVDWLGFRQEIVPFAADARHAGKATYSMRKRVKLAINGIVAHSTRPLKLVSVLGAFISFLSVAATLFLLFEKYLFGDPLNLAISGAAILALFLSFLIGVVLICQGLLALYLESVYYETQNRPLYVVREQSE